MLDISIFSPFNTCFLSFQHQLLIFVSKFSCSLQMLSINTLPHKLRLSTTLGKKHFENIVRKGENGGNQHCLLFPCFLPYRKQISTLWVYLCCCLQMLSICFCLKFCCLIKSYNKSMNLFFGKGLTLSQTSPGFYMSAVQVLKTTWEKEKLLVTSNFSCSHSVFYPFGELSAIFIKFKIVVCKLFQFGTV